MLVPDYNLQDVTGPGDYVLEMMEHRATKPLGEQFMCGFNGRPGDSVSSSLCSAPARLHRPGPNYRDLIVWTQRNISNT